MRKIILMFIFLAVNNCAMADWTKIYVTDSSAEYADLSRAVKVGSNVRMWSLSDLRRPMSFMDKSSLSVLSLIEYDCLNSRTAIVQWSMYEGSMQSGSVVASKTNEYLTWNYSPPNSMGNAIKLAKTSL